MENKYNNNPPSETQSQTKVPFGHITQTRRHASVESPSQALTFPISTTMPHRAPLGIAGMTWANLCEGGRSWCIRHLDRGCCRHQTCRKGTLLVLSVMSINLILSILLAFLQVPPAGAAPTTSSPQSSRGPHLCHCPAAVVLSLPLWKW